MSKSLLRNLLDAALEGGLSLNEWRAFAAILRQTVGYGKRADPLTDRRIAQLTQIRKDRVRAAVQSVIDRGLFNVAPHKWLENTYTIPDGFFDGESTARFFAPSAPLNGDAPRPMGEFPHSTGTYRDLPLQSSTDTDKQADAAVVCDLNPVTGIKKPDAVDVETYIALLPALRKLENGKAMDVLALLSAAILDRSIKTTPVRLGGALIKAAAAGTLDTSRLAASRPTLAPERQDDPETAAKRAAFEAQAERSHLEMMARLSGIPLSSLMGGAA